MKSLKSVKGINERVFSSHSSTPSHPLSIGHVGFLKHRQRHHPGPAQMELDLPGRLIAGHQGHGDIYHDHIGPKPAGRIDRLAAVARLADNSEIRLLVQEGRQPFPRDLVIVDEQRPVRNSNDYAC